MEDIELHNAACVKTIIDKGGQARPSALQPTTEIDKGGR